MTLYTFDLLAGEVIVMQPNDVLNLPGNTIDYRKITIPVSTIKRIVLERNEKDGINIILLSNDKETINPQYVSRVGAVVGDQVNQDGIPGTFGSQSEILNNAFHTLLGWV